MIARGTAIMLAVIGGIGVCWLLMLRKRKKAPKPQEDEPTQDESSEE